jgi:class 3 adenylate cyclase/tetratricopeptide (TPR) repeat protein
VICSSCGADNREGARFCGECGSPLAAACPTCGAPNPPDKRFCDQCGSELVGAQATPSSPARTAPTSERRLVSVLFADLVGFTALSEERDAEEVRELLSRYFDAGRQVIDRFGGTVEKFIGDAVMAVWGTPVAREDDAERAVRAALDIVDAVAALGAEIGQQGLRARAAVMTGEASVTVGAEGEGMVAGDLVNTASRVQALADPGAVLVGERTRRATEAAIAYEDAGSRGLRGKAEGVMLARALRVTGARGGVGKSAGLEAPFVGREREFRLVKELFHATAEERRPRLISVVGLPGIGKSRLSWELEKYLDGLVDNVWWHRGRCLPYGEGVSYWALAEMVRMRARIAEAEDASTAAARLRNTLEEHFGDADERSWVEARLAPLLGLSEPGSSDRQDLFSAWRRLFERLAEQSPCVLVFEDLQWADSALLDFVEHLLEWSRNHPLFVLTLARPELAERRPDWGIASRNFHLLSLEPLSDQAMDRLMSGLVPGLAAELRDQIRDRADGVPLYAVETVRMLLDRGLVERAGDEYRPVGAIESLDVPDSLHALIAARLDGLDPEERALTADASILGKTFGADALAALAGRTEAELEPLLQSLVRKEVLSFQADPRSPERGQYGFLQALVQKVAHDTLSRKEQKARHLAAAAYFETSWGSEEEEIVEVVASHLLDAYEADPDAPDAADLRARARDTLARAGERAASLAAAAEAQRYFEQAARLADDRRSQAELLEQAGQAAQAAARGDEAGLLFERAIALFEAEGDTHPAARVAARLGRSLEGQGATEEALKRMEESFAVLSRDKPDEDLAALAAELARTFFFSGDIDRATERLEFALELAESLWIPEILSEALNTKSLILAQGRGRNEEAEGLLRHALLIALDNDIAPAALRAYFNLSHTMIARDRIEEAQAIDREGQALARRRGDRLWELFFYNHLVGEHYWLGEWDETLDLAAEVPTEDPNIPRLAVMVAALRAMVHGHRGDLGAARAELAVFGRDLDRGNLQEGAGYDAAESTLLLAEGRPSEALAAADAAFAVREPLGLSHPLVKLGYVGLGEAALALGDLERVRGLVAEVDAVPRGQRPPFLAAQAARFDAHTALARGDHARAEQRIRSAVASLRELSYRFWLAVTLLEYAELPGNGEAAAAATEARQLFERMRATPWIERSDALLTRVAAPVG